MKKLFRTLLATILPLVAHSVFSAEKLPPYYVAIKDGTLTIQHRYNLDLDANLVKKHFTTANELKKIIQNTKEEINSIKKIEIDSYEIKKDELNSLFTVLPKKDQTVCLKLSDTQIIPTWEIICNNANKINELELIYLKKGAENINWNTFITNAPNNLTLRIHDYNPKNYLINNLLQALAQHNNKNTYLNLYFEEDTEADWRDFTNKCNAVQDGSIKSVKSIRFGSATYNFASINTLLNKFDFNHLDYLFLYTSNQKGFLEKLKKDQDLIEKFKKLTTLVIEDCNHKNHYIDAYNKADICTELEKLNNSAPEPEEQEDSKEEEEDNTTAPYISDSEEKNLLDKTKNKKLKNQIIQEQLEPEQPESWFTIENAAYATAALGSCYLVYRWFTKKKQQPQPIKRTKDGTLPTFAQIQNTTQKKLSA